MKGGITNTNTNPHSRGQTPLSHFFKPISATPLPRTAPYQEQPPRYKRKTQRQTVPPPNTAPDQQQYQQKHEQQQQQQQQQNPNTNSPFLKPWWVTGASQPSTADTNNTRDDSIKRKIDSTTQPTTAITNPAIITSTTRSVAPMVPRPTRGKSLSPHDNSSTPVTHCKASCVFVFRRYTTDFGATSHSWTPQSAQL
jgi:hypothetical protein